MHFVDWWRLKKTFRNGVVNVRKSEVEKPVSSFYQHYRNFRNKFIKREITKYIPQGKLLEIGFGDDNLIKFFHKEFDVFGIETSHSSVKEIRERYNPNHFKICDISRDTIPFNVKFDVICAINVFEHMQDPKFALRNIFNALKKEGIFTLYLPTRSNLLSKFQYKILGTF